MGQLASKASNYTSRLTPWLKKETPPNTILTNTLRQRQHDETTRKEMAQQTLLRNRNSIPHTNTTTSIETKSVRTEGNDTHGIDENLMKFLRSEPMVTSSTTTPPIPTNISSTPIPTQRTTRPMPLVQEPNDLSHIDTTHLRDLQSTLTTQRTTSFSRNANVHPYEEYLYTDLELYQYLQHGIVKETPIMEGDAYGDLRNEEQKQWLKHMKEYTAVPVMKKDVSDGEILGVWPERDCEKDTGNPWKEELKVVTFEEDGLKLNLEVELELQQQQVGNVPVTPVQV